ncbi:MAG TPA: hypothetical protein VFF27_13890 [Bacteroidia bacterium]|jgi:hypothetical protein|nr:hypothetical protein [Bacteroidia bacterium]
MKEFMLHIKNVGDGKAALSAEEHLAFIKKCETYIGKLKDKGTLIAAQPIIREGIVISKNAFDWRTYKMKEEKTNFVYPQ